MMKEAVFAKEAMKKIYVAQIGCSLVDSSDQEISILRRCDDSGTKIACHIDAQSLFLGYAAGMLYGAFRRGKEKSKGNATEKDLQEFASAMVAGLTQQAKGDKDLSVEQLDDFVSASMTAVEDLMAAGLLGSSRKDSDEISDGSQQRIADIEEENRKLKAENENLRFALNQQAKEE